MNYVVSKDHNSKWEILPFEKVVDNFDGKRVPIKSNNRINTTGKYPYYGASGVIDYVDDFIFDGEFLLISEDGANLLARTYPIAFIAEGKFWVNNHAHVVSAKKEKSSNKYLEYFFASIKLDEFITGSAQPKLSQKKLNSIQIPLPSISIQKRIVSKLDELFTNLDKAINLVEENIEHAKHILPAALNEIFGKADTLGWELYVYDNIQKDNLIGLVKNTTEQNKSYQYKYLKMNNIRPNGLLDMDNYTCINATKQELDKFELRKGDFLFNTRNSIELVGKSCVFDLDEKNILFNNNILRTRFKDFINPYFLGYQFKSSFIQEQLNAIKSGTTNVAAIYYKSLANVKLYFPSFSEQQKIVNHLNQLTEKQQALQQQYTAKLKHLKALKASLLSAAFKGQL